MRPGKIIAVHLNYASRVEQRGRRPDVPSYFLKPTSSIGRTGGSVERPAGTELLVFEGEVALVIGTRADRVPKSDAWDYVESVTAANDFGLQDLQPADAGSNLRSKGRTGYTPLGPEFIDARAVAPDSLRLRTWVDDELVQDDRTSNLLFGFPQLVADLSQHLVLEPGDVILTGTPAGATVVEPGSEVIVEVDSPESAGSPTSGRLRTSVVAGADGFDPDLGAVPAVDDALRARARGTSQISGVTGEGGGVPKERGAGTPPLSSRSHRADTSLCDKASQVSVATLSRQLRTRGLNNVVIEGVYPLADGERMAGRARTLRFIPGREDLFGTHGGGYNTQKRAFDELGAGEVLVIDAREERGAGTLGDVLGLRARVNGAAGVVTDGAVRDRDALVATGIPVFARNAHPAVLGRRHVPWDRDVTIACGGTAVEPGDLIVGDGDGVVVVPADIAEEIVDDATEQEIMDGWVADMVAEGHPVHGLFPPEGQWKTRYAEWRATR